MTPVSPTTLLKYSMSLFYNLAKASLRAALATVPNPLFSADSSIFFNYLKL
jgi:hypothetical protein